MTSNPAIGPRDAFVLSMLTQALFLLGQVRDEVVELRDEVRDLRGEDVDV